MDFSEDNHEIPCRSSDNSEVEDLSIGCDFQNLQPYQFEPEKQNQATLRCPINEGDAYQFFNSFPTPTELFRTDPFINFQGMMK